MKRKIDRSDILQAGMDLMFLYGYNATGIKDITDRVEIPKGSFYNHFSSKEEFTLEMFANYFEGGIQHYNNTLLNNDKKSPYKRIDQLFSEMATHSKNVNDCKKGCFMSNFSAELADTNEQFRVALGKSFETLEGILEQCVKEGQKDGSINKELNAASISSFMLNSWHGALIRMKAAASDKSLTDFRKTILQILKP